MNYTAREHAFIYGVIAQELMRIAPDAGETLAESIRVYGLQRGARMGQTAEKFGDERSMRTYLAYGEWAPAPGEMDVEIPQNSPSAVWHVKKCPWCQEWTEKGMLDVGKYYCKYVDRELVHGFNAELELGTGTTQTNGDAYCFFEWAGADMTPENKAANAEIAKKTGSARLKTWAYHMAHIYKTMGEVIGKDLGREKQEEIFRAADARIEEHLGAETVELMHLGRMLDFWVTPSLEPTNRLSEFF